MEPSTLPLSATMTSPRIPALCRKAVALAMHAPIDSTSLRHGITIDNSSASSAEGDAVNVCSPLIVGPHSFRCLLNHGSKGIRNAEARGSAHDRRAGRHGAVSHQ